MKFFIFLPFIFILGCNPKASIDSVPDAKKIANKFITGLQKSEYDSLLELYSNDFWKSISKDTWKKILPNINAELGSIKACELINWNQRTQASTSGTGNFVVLQYDCEHEKYKSTIVFTIYKPLKGGSSKIVSQNINSIGFLIE